mgnify:CR=1 FL=1
MIGASAEYWTQDDLVTQISNAYRLIFTSMSFKSTNYRFASEKDLFAVYAILVTVSVITRKLHLYSQSRSPRRKIRFCFIDTTFFTFGRYINVSFKQFLASNQKVCRFIRFFIFFYWAYSIFNDLPKKSLTQIYL